jgi:NTE family protein
LSPYEIEGIYSDGGILNHFPDILQGQCDTVIGVYVSPIQKIEAKVRSIKAVTTRAFDILSANSNMHKFNIATGLLNQRICVFIAPETSSKDECGFLTLVMKPQKNHMKNLVYKI